MKERELTFCMGFSLPSPLSSSLKARRGEERYVRCRPVSAFCIVSHAADFVSSRKDHPQGEGEGRWVTRQKRLQGRSPFAQVEHNYPDSIAKVCFAS